MSFLKKLGNILTVVGPVIPGIGGIEAVLAGGLLGSGSPKAVAATGTITTVTNDFTAIASMIVQVEVALQGKTGPEKLAAAINLIGPVIRTSSLVAGKKIADEALLQKGIEEVTQGVVDVLNSLHEDNLKH